jgi:hypothetical protein
MRQAEAPFRQSGGFTIRPDIAGRKLTALPGRSKGFAAGRDHCLASGAASTALQAGGNCASVIGGRGFGGFGGGFGRMIESLNQ